MEAQIKPAFVTGGTGLVGSHLIYTLISRGVNVRAIHRKSSNRVIINKLIEYYGGNEVELLSRLEWVESDINDPVRLAAVMKGSELVYHCAAAVSFGNKDKNLVIDNNVKGTANIVRACLENNIRKLCHVSSNAALGAYDGEQMVNEDHGWDEKGYRSPYGISKYLSEREVWKGISEGLNAVIVNPTLILGPGDWKRGSVSFFSKIDEGLLFHTSGTNGYVDVNDVVKAMILLTDSDISGERFILNSGNLDYGQFFSMIAKSLNIRGPVIGVPRALSYPAMLVAQLLEVITGGRSALTKEIVKVAWSKITYDSSKITRLTGFSFTPVEKTVNTIAKIYLKEKGRISN
ncbi:MAG: NAD-dependent epimerase/dehydratase family protein [Bacteroidales bacterium]|nr:NAD-dependent epimerase/dehydratase family protein [Bacteroidales bacterium]